MLTVHIENNVVNTHQGNAKTTTWHPYTLTRMAKMKSVDEDVAGTPRHCLLECKHSFC